MPWIESHTELREHPKVSMLADSMGWSVFETIGRLHCFWYWCLAYAPTGDLRKFNDAQLGSAVVLNGADCERFVKAMVEARWLDRGDGIFRVHDWTDYAGRYLRDTKFKRNPEKWAETEQLYLKEICQPTVSRQSAVTTNQPTVPTHPPTSRAGVRLHGIPSSVEEVIAYGKTCQPKPVSEERCREFWAHYEGQARTNPNGDVFWVTSGEAVVTNWRAKLPVFGSQKDNPNGTSQRSGRQSADRSAGTANEGTSERYERPNPKIIR